MSEQTSTQVVSSDNGATENVENGRTEISPEIRAKIAPLGEMFKVFKTFVSACNSRAAKIKAATSDRSEAVDAVLSTSEDPRIVEWREKDSEIRAKIKAAEERLAAQREAIKAYAITQVPGVDAEFNVENEKKAFAEDRQKATAIRKSLLLILGNDEAALSAGMQEHGIVEVVSFRGNTAGTSKGSTNIRRPRISAAEVSLNGADPVSVDDGKGKVSFTILTDWLKKQGVNVEGDTVRKSAFAAAGTEDLSTLPGGTEVKFTITSGDKRADVTVTTKGTDSPAEGTPAPAEGDSQGE